MDNIEIKKTGYTVEQHGKNFKCKYLTNRCECNYMETESTDYAQEKNKRISGYENSFEMWETNDIDAKSDVKCMDKNSVNRHLDEIDDFSNIENSIDSDKNRNNNRNNNKNESYLGESIKQFFANSDVKAYVKSLETENNNNTSNGDNIKDYFNNNRQTNGSRQTNNSETYETFNHIESIPYKDIEQNNIYENEVFNNEQYNKHQDNYEEDSFELEFNNEGNSILRDIALSFGITIISVIVYAIGIRTLKRNFIIVPVIATSAMIGISKNIYKGEELNIVGRLIIAVFSVLQFFVGGSIGIIMLNEMSMNFDQLILTFSDYFNIVSVKTVVSIFVCGILSLIGCKAKLRL